MECHVENMLCIKDSLDSIFQRQRQISLGSLLMRFRMFMQLSHCLIPAITCQWQNVFSNQGNLGIHMEQLLNRVSNVECLGMVTNISWNGGNKLFQRTNQCEVYEIC